MVINFQIPSISGGAYPILEIINFKVLLDIALCKVIDIYIQTDELNVTILLAVEW